MMRLTLAALLALSTPAAAQIVTECEWIGAAQNILEPWEVHSRTYANGAIRVAVADTGGEPACCSSHLMVLSPSGDGREDPVWRQCRIVSASEGLGFYAIDIPGIIASYDPARGLLLSVPVAHWHDGVNDGRPPIPERMEVRINQANGSVTVE